MDSLKHYLSAVCTLITKEKNKHHTEIKHTLLFTEIQTRLYYLFVYAPLVTEHCLINLETTEPFISIGIVKQSEVFLGVYKIRNKR